jgi:hypothetical protein
VYALQAVLEGVVVRVAAKVSAGVTLELGDVGSNLREVSGEVLCGEQETQRRESLDGPGYPYTRSPGPSPCFDLR